MTDAPPPKLSRRAIRLRLLAAALALGAGAAAVVLAILLVRSALL